jgi:hypothetical protein
MILQTDRRLNKDINGFGCYFMSIMFLVNKYIGFELSTVTLNRVFTECVGMGYIENNQTYRAFINSSEKIFNHLGLKVKYNDRHDPPKYKCTRDEIEILCLKYEWGKHFVVGDGRGNIAYNPMGRTQSGYVLQSKRIFKLL